MTKDKRFHSAYGDPMLAFVSYRSVISFFFTFFLSQSFILPAISKTREWMNGWINGRSLLLFVGCVIRINSDEENHRPTNNAISIILLEKYPIIFNIYIYVYSYA